MIERKCDACGEVIPPKQQRYCMEVKKAKVVEISDGRPVIMADICAQCVQRIKALISQPAEQK